MSTSSDSIKLPPAPYDLSTAQTCAFLVNVACDMGQQWLHPNRRVHDSFSWKPHDPCRITSSGQYNVDDVSFGEPIWSTFNDKNGNPQTEPFGFIATYKGKSYLVFRGSQTGADFDMDFKAELTIYSPPSANPRKFPPRVEAGFYAVYNGLLESLTSQLKSLSGSLIITGHSLGSALATLAGPLAFAQGLKAQVYNEASPKVGDLEFAIYYSALTINTFRLVNTADSVPNDPPGEIYRHVGTPVEFTADYPNKDLKVHKGNNHSACCTYAYAIFHPDSPFNPDFDTCSKS